MKCINQKCDRGLWTKDGCLFPSENDETCVDFIPEPKQDDTLRLAGSVSMSEEEKAIKMLSYLKRLRRATGKPMLDAQAMIGLPDVVRDLEKQNV